MKLPCRHTSLPSRKSSTVGADITRYSPASSSFLFQHPPCQRDIPLPDLIGRRRVGTGEVEAVAVVFQEHRLKMRQMVVVTEKTPDAVAHRLGTPVELSFLQGGELVDQELVYDEVLPAVRPLALVPMVANTGDEKLSHQEIRIAEQSWDACPCRHDLGVKGAAAVANKEIGALILTDASDELQDIMGMERQVWREDIGGFGKCLAQRHGGHAAAAGEEAM